MGNEHDDSVKFSKDLYVEVSAGELPGWSFERSADGLFAAGGPCPSCHGSAYGPRLVDVSDHTTKSLPGQDVDVASECRCGFDHGGGPDAGCGRWWIASYRATAL